MKKVVLTSPSERGDPQKGANPPEIQLTVVKLTFVSNFTDKGEKDLNSFWFQKTAFFPIFCEIGKKIFLEKCSRAFDDISENYWKEKYLAEHRERKITPGRSASSPCRRTGLKKNLRRTPGPGYEDKFTPKPFEE